MAVKKVSYENMVFEINYEIKNPKNTKDIILLHGWGSNKDIMKRAFGSRFSNFRHIYIDMPGFGKSTNEYILDTHSYAKIVEEFLKSIDAKKDIIFGHSFGGKVASLLDPNLLVLLSNSGILTPKPLKTKIKIKLFKLAKKLGGGSFFRFFASKDVEGMSQNMYESFKKIVDEDFSSHFSNLKTKTLIFWGEDDKATPLKSGLEVSKLIKNSKFYKLKGDHYFFLQHFIFIEKALLKELNG